MPRIADALLALLVCAGSTFAQQKPQYDMGKMQMIFLSRSPDWKAGDGGGEIDKQHHARLKSLVTEGKLALAGEVGDEGDLRQIMVLKTESVDEAQQLAQSLPAVKGGMLKADVLSWYAAKNVIGTPEIPLTRADYIFGLIVRGPNWTKEETEETKKIQEGHMANIRRLAEAGKLVLAGPFFRDGERRGVFIFKVDSLKEAQELAETDPAVIAGRLRVELHRWSVPKGMLP